MFNVEGHAAHCRTAREITIIIIKIMIQVSCVPYPSYTAALPYINRNLCIILQRKCFWSRTGLQSRRGHGIAFPTGVTGLHSPRKGLNRCPVLHVLHTKKIKRDLRVFSPPGSASEGKKGSKKTWLQPVRARIDIHIIVHEAARATDACTVPGTW